MRVSDPDNHGRRIGDVAELFLALPLPEFLLRLPQRLLGAYGPIRLATAVNRLPHREEEQTREHDDGYNQDAYALPRFSERLDGLRIAHREIAPAGRHQGKPAFFGDRADLLADFIRNSGRSERCSDAQVGADRWYPNHTHRESSTGYTVEQRAERAVFFDKRPIDATLADFRQGVLHGRPGDQPRLRKVFSREIGNDWLVEMAEGSLLEILDAAIGSVLANQKKEPVHEASLM
jgi:hypothetical protein